MRNQIEIVRSVQLRGAGRRQLGRRRRRPDSRLQARAGAQRRRGIDLQRPGRSQPADWKRRKGLGSGVTIFEAFALLRSATAAIQLPPVSDRRRVPDRHGEGADERLRARRRVGKTFSAGPAVSAGPGRRWSRSSRTATSRPARKTNWDVVRKSRSRSTSASISASTSASAADQQHGRPRHAGAVLCAVGLVRRRSAGWLVGTTEATMVGLRRR